MLKITSVVRDADFHVGNCDDRSNSSFTILITCVGNGSDGTEDLSTEVQCDRVLVLLYWYGDGTKMQQGRYADGLYY